MAEEVIFSTLQKLNIILLYKEGSWPAMEEVKKDLSLILNFLEDFIPNHNKLLNYLIADFVELANNIGDALPREYIYEEYDTDERLRKLRLRIFQLGWHEGQGAEAPDPLRPPNDGDSDAVGLEETVEFLLRQEILSGETHDKTGPYLCVIEGVGGIGKTTLAKELYNHASVAAHFQHRCWVCVSGEKTNKQILMELIVQVGECAGFESLEEMDNRSLQKLLSQHLNGKRYLVVLDNAGDDTCSRSIFQALPDDRESRLLLTTQSHRIRRNIQFSPFKHSHCYHHKMKFLEDDKSWELFLTTVCCGSTVDDEFPKKLEEKGRKMVKQCDGLPLAIIEMGRQLVIKTVSGIEWEELLESPIDFTQTLAALESSYQNLTKKSRAIFLCLGFFEEGTTIRIEKLLQVAIAQRFISSRKEGDDALNELKRYSFVETAVLASKIHRSEPLQIRIIFHRLSVKRAKEDINFEILRKDGSIHHSNGVTTSCRNTADEVIFSTIRELNVILDNYPWDDDKKESMEEVKKDLTLILNFLDDFIPKHNKLLNYLIADFVELANDIDDSLSEEYIFTDYAAESRLRKLRPRIFQLGWHGGPAAEPPDPLKPPNVGDSDAVGLEETVEFLLRQEILSHATHTQKGPYLCIIEGVGGMGKTTLAKELYNHASVAAHFQHRCWVCVSGEKPTKQILMELIVQVGECAEFESLEEMDNRSLQKLLSQHLNGKRYLIVLDDAGDDTCSRSIFQALPNDTKSRLLLTTQSHLMRTSLQYSPFTHSHRYHYKMKFLEDDESWELFLKTVRCDITGDDEFPKKLEKKGRKMLKQCGGLPLAIIEMGTQLAIKRQSGIKWEELLESTIDFTQTLAALESSYRNFTQKSRAIFMCLGFFEEGTTIRIEKLLQIAMAQRCISSRKEGDDALNELKRYSFVETTLATKIHRPKHLQIRIIFHRLSIKRAKEEINFEILRKDGSSPSSEQPLHRVIYCSREEFNYSMDKDAHLVSLFFRGGGYLDASPSYWERFEQLVILDMEGFGLKMVPETIGMLIGLRYLGLRNNYIKKLPLSLRCLKNLEVLDIALNLMVEVPDIIWEMDSLRHLYMSNIMCLGHLKIRALENIETLTYVSVDNWIYELSGLRMMHNLHKLGIEEVDGDSDVNKLFASLAKLKNINYLTLRGFRYKSMPLLDGIRVLHRITTLRLDGPLTRLPSADNFPPNIRYLTLVNSSLDEDPMPILEKLSNLYFLRLRNAYTGQRMVILRDGFMGLNFLYLEELWHLRNIQVKKLEKWSLYQLEINNCPYLETLPKVTSKREGFKIVTNGKNCLEHKGRR